MSALANPDPLAQLNDIIAPTSPNWWPPAPIYWLLLFITVVLIVAAFYLLKSYLTAQQKQKTLRSKLNQLQQHQADFITLNQLLKGCALSYFSREEVASLHGEAWYDFLQKHSKTTIFTNKPAFMLRLYTPEAQQCSEQDFAQAKQWLTDLPKQVKKSNIKRNNIKVGQ